MVKNISLGFILMNLPHNVPLKTKQNTPDKSQVYYVTLIPHLL